MGDLLFFDLGWTLEDETDAQVRRARTAAAASSDLGYPFDFQYLLRLQDEAGTDGVPEVFPEALKRLGLSAHAAVQVKRAAVWDTSLLTLYPDARAALKRLSEFHDLGIVANQSRPVESRLRDYGIRDLLNTVVCSCEVGVSKPDPRIFRMALEEAGASGRRVWMIGDRIDNDIVPAKRMGWTTVRIRSGSHRGQIPKDADESPDHTVAGLADLVDLVM